MKTNLVLYIYILLYLSLNLVKYMKLFNFG